MFVSKRILEEMKGMQKGRFQWPPSQVRVALAGLELTPLGVLARLMRFSAASQSPLRTAGSV